MTQNSPLGKSKDVLNPPISRKDCRGTNAVEPRTEAEAITSAMETRLADDPENLSLDDIRHALHELRVHQIELESQNDVLRRTQTELDAARARYFELYDLAPVGYCTLNEHELILEANLTAAALLGVPRGALANQPITRFILGESQDDLHFRRKQLSATGTPQAWKLRMSKSDGTEFWAWIEATVIQRSVGTRVCHIALIDINERLNADLASKRSEEALRQTQTVEGIGVQASGIAHDFNNLLNAMIGQSDLAIRKLPRSSPARSHVEKTIKAADLTSANSMEGIELYRTHHEGIAAMILDYSMPGMDGKAAFEALMKINADIKVLLCSGYSEEEMAAAFGTVRPSGFIQKPYIPKLFMERVSKVISP
jgi:PAS domain S-box-containing protein